MVRDRAEIAAAVQKQAIEARKIAETELAEYLEARLLSSHSRFPPNSPLLRDFATELN